VSLATRDPSDVTRAALWHPAVVADAAVPEFRRKLLAWGRKHRRSFPWRETDDPFRVLVAEVMLQRSRGVTVEKVYRDLFRRWPDAASLGRARESSIAAVIRPLGLVRRAGTLKAMARDVVSRGGVPETLEGLRELSGVGPYAAGATLVVAFDKRAPIVDGVSARVYRRYFGIEDALPASNDPGLWELVDRTTPSRGVRDWNWAVLDLAAAICLPRVPRCESCPLAARCAWSQARVDPV
jgi:A/G-specific adenine glycosylase